MYLLNEEQLVADEFHNSMEIHGRKAADEILSRRVSIDMAVHDSRDDLDSRPDPFSNMVNAFYEWMLDYGHLHENDKTVNIDKTFIDWFSVRCEYVLDLWDMHLFRMHLFQFTVTEPYRAAERERKSLAWRSGVDNEPAEQAALRREIHKTHSHWYNRDVEICDKCFNDQCEECPDFNELAGRKCCCGKYPVD